MHGMDIRALGIRVPSEGFLSEDLALSLTEMKEKAIASLMTAMNLAIRLKEKKLVENAATYLWNLHLHIFKDHNTQRMNSALPAVKDFLRAIAEALISINTDNMHLCSQVSDALMHMLECEGKFEEAVECAKWCAARCPTTLYRSLHTTLARMRVLAQREKSVKVESRPEIMVMEFLERIRHGGADNDENGAKKGYFEKAYDIMCGSELLKSLVETTVPEEIGCQQTEESRKPRLHFSNPGVAERT